MKTNTMADMAIGGRGTAGAGRQRHGGRRMDLAAPLLFALGGLATFAWIALLLRAVFTIVV